MIDAGKAPSTPVALVESATLSTEHRRLASLAQLAGATLARAEGPVVVCVGEVFRDCAGAVATDFPQLLAMNEHR